MARDYSIVISEMIATIEEIQKLLANESLESYRERWALRRATERGIEIVSEASRRLPPELTDRFPEIPWPRVRAIGNVLRHEYHEIADRVVWMIYEDDLPVLKGGSADHASPLMTRRPSSGRSNGPRASFG